MIIFLYGQDSYGIRKKQKEIVEHYLVCAKDDAPGSKKGANYVLRVFDGDNLDFQNFKKETETYSIFKEKKLIVLRNIFSDKKFKEEFMEEADKIIKSDDLILICEDGDVDKRDSLFKLLKKKTKTQEFQPPEGQKLEKWVKDEFDNYKAQTDNNVPKKLIIFVGNDIWHLENEIKKLVSYSCGRRITEKDIQNLVRPKIENDIFETIDALAGGKKEIALYLIHKHIEKGDSPLYLLSMINFQFRNLIGIRELMEKKYPYYDIAKKSGLHPFVVRKTYLQAQRFTFQKLKKIYQKIFQTDLSVKTGKVDPEEALDLLISGI